MLSLARESLGEGHEIRPAARDARKVRQAARIVRLFDIDVHDTTLDAAARDIVGAASRDETMTVAFLNAHCINTLFRDDVYRRAVKGADRVYADGIGMRIAASASGFTLADNVNGTDLLPVLCRKAARSGCGLYFLGGAKGVAAAAALRMVAANPDLDVFGAHHGFFGDEAEESGLIEEINASGASVLLVGLGVPLQETWIARNRHRIHVPVILAVGGLFDYYSGRIQRAPLALRRWGLEWAWRLAMEPRRLANRYILGNAEFLARVVRLRLMAPRTLGDAMLPESAV